MKLHSTQSLIENMIKNPKSYDKEFKQMYIDARQFSSHKTVMIIYMIIFMIAAAFLIEVLYAQLQKIEWFEDTIRVFLPVKVMELIAIKPYEDLRMYFGILVIEFIILLYATYTGLFTFETHYVSVSSNTFANSLNAHISFWIILLVCLVTVSVSIKSKEKDGNEIRDDILLPYLLIGLFAPFSLIWFYIMYYNYGNKKIYQNGNILKFKKENGCINVYIYDTVLRIDKLIIDI